MPLIRLVDMFSKRAFDGMLLALITRQTRNIKLRQFIYQRKTKDRSSSECLCNACTSLANMHSQIELSAYAVGSGE